MAIAQAVIEYIHDKVRARTLFSTHFHELTKLEYSSSGCAVTAWRWKKGGDLLPAPGGPGSTDRSYGINVARMAGVPLAVIKGPWSSWKSWKPGQRSPPAGSVQDLRLRYINSRDGGQ